MLAALLSFYVLFWPDPAGPDTAFPYADKLVHASLFALLTATATWRFGVRREVVAVVAAYAVLSEVVQALLLPGRSGDPLDAVADLCGVALVLYARTGAARRSRAADHGE